MLALALALGIELDQLVLSFLGRMEDAAVGTESHHSGEELPQHQREQEEGDGGFRKFFGGQDFMAAMARRVKPQSALSQSIGAVTFWKM